MSGRWLGRAWKANGLGLGIVGGLAALALLISSALAAAWGTGVEARLPTNAGSNPNVVLSSVSCASAGNCSVVGDYTDRSGHQQGVLLTQRSGRWARGVEVMLPANAATNAAVTFSSVSCASAGYCSAVGFYFDRSGAQQGLLLAEHSGRWARGVEATLPANAVSGNPNVSINSVSCASAGDCSAVGVYADGLDRFGGLLLTERSGRWARGIEARLPTGASSSPSPALSAVSCATASNCSAVGSYLDDASDQHGLLLTQHSGRWSRGVEASVPANAGPNPDVSFNSVSCGAAGSCSAVGSYLDRSAKQRALVVAERSGRWAKGVQPTLPGSAGANLSLINSVSCASRGGCSAVGQYANGSGQLGGLLLTESSGRWAKGIRAGLPANAGSSPNADLISVSCASAGNCTAIGGYLDSASTVDGMLLTEHSGGWSRGTEARVPAGGTAVQYYLPFDVISCASTGGCSAVGDYADSTGHQQGVLLSTPTQPASG
jgi:hypothetical protein